MIHNRAQLLEAKVMHKRLLPKINAFSYHVYYVSLPLNILEESVSQQALPLPINRLGRHSFYLQDHGYRDERSLRTWVNDLLLKYQQPIYENITLICMPRVIGYVFNPVSFWICRDDKQQIKAIICEVNNTFGQTHTYLCLPSDTENPSITSQTKILAKKCFHVSPFLQRNGAYEFRFDITDLNLKISIDYYDEFGDKTLLTQLSGQFTPLTKKSLNRAFWRCPLVTLKAIYLIHYQALRLVLKKIPFIPLPKQLAQRDSKTERYNK